MANGDVPGICTYVHFVTNELIDLKKVFVTVLGAEEKDKIGFERVAYKDEFGSLDGFVEIAAGVEEREVPLSQVLPLQTNVDENVIVLWDENESKFYYKNLKNLEPEDLENRERYNKWGFDELIHEGFEEFDGMKIDVLYYRKKLD